MLFSNFIDKITIIRVHSLFWVAGGHANVYYLKITVRASLPIILLVSTINFIHGDGHVQPDRSLILSTEAKDLFRCSLPKTNFIIANFYPRIRRNCQLWPSATSQPKSYYHNAAQV